MGGFWSPGAARTSPGNLQVDKLSPEEVVRVEPRRVFELYEGWPANVEDALKTVVDVRQRPYDRVIYLAVGGSATAGDIISDWFLSSGRVEVSVYRGNLPKVHLENALVVVCSTSGDTEETLQMWRGVMGSHPDTVAISAGGRLREMAESEGVPHVAIKLTKAPRFSLPYSLFASVAVLRSASLLEGIEWEVDETVATMKSTWERIGVKVPTVENPSKLLASEVSDTEPCVYATSVTKSVARRFKNSLNENAKMRASFAAAPDFLHNEVEAWEFPDARERPVILGRPGDPRSETRSLEAFGLMLARRGVRETRVSASGNGNLAELMNLCYTLDVASYYAAILRGVEPFGIGLIDELKKTR